MPVLGIVASQISGHLFAPSGAYDSIATVTVGSGGSSTITFSSIPSTYKHLQIRAIARGTSTVDAFVLTCNSDTSTSDYNGHYLNGNGTSASASNFGASGYMFAGQMTKNADTASSFGVSIIDILDYTSVNKNKTLRSLTGYDNNGAGSVSLFSGLWFNSPSNAAITTINIFPNASTGNFAQYSSFALYGIRGN